MDAPEYVKIPLSEIGQDVIDEDDDYPPIEHFIARVVARGQAEGKTLVEGVHTGDRFHVDPAVCVAHEGMWL